MGAAPREPIVLVDTHVHIHDGFDRGRLFATAAAHLEATARGIAPGSPRQLVLVLTERSTEDAFRELERQAGRAARPGPGASCAWSVDGTDEDCALLVRVAATDATAGGESPAEGTDLLVVAGRQAVTREGLEVLSFPTRGPARDGDPLARLLEETEGRGEIAVLPWGFGKWRGRRRRTLEAALEEAADTEDRRLLFAGDSSTRPWLLPPPGPFRLARRRGVPILGGSDPLPLRGEERRAGRLATLVSGRIDPRHPATGLVRLLREERGSLRLAGRRDGLLSFVRAQAGAQWKKRSAAAPAATGGPEIEAATALGAEER